MADGEDAHHADQCAQRPAVRVWSHLCQRAKALFKDVEKALDDLADKLPQMVRDSLREQVERIKALGQDMQANEKRLALQLKVDPQMQRIAQIPGVGVLTATAAIATMGEASAFKSGREFCAWLGLVPTQTGSGGKVRLDMPAAALDSTGRQAALFAQIARKVINQFGKRDLALRSRC